MAALDSIQHIFGGEVSQILQDWVPNLDPSGFDTAVLRIDFRGGIPELIAAYKKGTPLPGTLMFITGILSIEDQRFRWITATIGAKGFWESTAPENVVSMDLSTTETRYPIVLSGTASSAVYDGLIVFSPAPGKAGGFNQTVNPQTGQPWRVRVFNEGWNITRSGVDIGTVGTTHQPPGKPGADLPAGSRPGTPEGWPDPLLTAGITGKNGAWVRQDYSCTSDPPLGTVVFRKWSDRWQWIPGNDY